MKSPQRGLKPALGLLLLLGAGGAAFVLLRPAKKAVTVAQEPKGQRPGAAGIPRGADKTQPVLSVGMATGYAPSVNIPTGPVSYNHMAEGWANWQGPIRNDWQQWLM